MTISSLNTNEAALVAQLNISNANTATTNEVAELSSGNRIVHASTDVASLATGTALASQVNTLNTVLTVASEGSSLLQVADGALSQIQSILQRQQAIATQAQSGSLSSTQLGFLNEEFQSLTSQINQLATSTNFNGVNLLNGSIAGGATATTNINAGNASSPYASTTVATAVAAGATTFSSTDTLTINGYSLSLANLTGATVTDTGLNIAAALNAADAPQLADYQFSSSAGVITATYTGQATGTIPALTTSTNAIAGHLTVGGTTATFTVGTTAATIGANLVTGGSGQTNVIAVNGVNITLNTTVNAGATVGATATNLVNYLNQTSNSAWAGITFVASGANILAYYNGVNSPSLTIADTTTGTNITNGATDATLNTGGVTGLGAGGVTAVGTIDGTGLFVSDTGGATSTTNYGQAVNLSGVNSNSAFVGNFGGTGSIGAINATYIGGSTPGVSFTVQVGAYTYSTGEISNTTLNVTSAPVALTFTGTNTASGATAGGSFTLNLIANQTAVTSQETASALAAALNTGLSTVSAYQNQNVLSYNNNYSALVGTTETGTLQGSTLSFNSPNSVNQIVSSVSVAAPGTGQTDAKIQLVVGGQTYSTIAGIGSTIGTNSVLTLENLSNPSETITLTTGSITDGTTGQAINLANSSDAAAFQTALTSALGISSANAALTFQIGSLTSNTLGVSIGSATSSSLFGGVSLDVNSQSDAATAENAVNTALNTVTALRANVGALEERLNYATNAISSASQNEGAAQSTLLDTDVAATSTQFATSQVQLQAGIAVLAQANQLQQNLLKLIS